VVTKGAERISEVSARFTLDALPGKQMAIDADLNAGLINQEGAQARRKEVAGEADFYGAMDGASKFVKGDAIAGAEVDVWQSAPSGLYENQDPSQAEMNLRGTFTTDAAGAFSFRSVRPAGYPVPTAGPTGALLRAQQRHNFRPAHLHFLIVKPGFKTIASQVYDPDDPHLETDSQFGVTKALIGRYEKAASGFSMQFTFVLEPGESSRPTPTITGKQGQTGAS